MDRSKRKNRKHRSFEENIRINKLIIQANNENAIFTIIKRQGVQFNIVNCSTSFSAFAKRAPINVNHEMFSQLCNITKTKFLDEKDKKSILSRHIAGVMWGLAKILTADGTIINRNTRKIANDTIKIILDYSLKYKFSRFTGQEISMCIYAVGKLPPQFSNHAALRLLFIAVENKINNAFNSQGLANIIYSLSAIFMNSMSMLSTSSNNFVLSHDTYLVLLKTVIEKLSSFNPQEFSNTLSGIAKIGFSIVYNRPRISNVNGNNYSNTITTNLQVLTSIYNKLHEKIDKEVKKIIHKCSAQNIVNILWALVKIESDLIVTEKIPFDQLPEAWDIEKLGLINILLKPNIMNDLKPLEISMIFWSLSRNMTFRHAYINNNNDKYHDFFDKMFEKIMMYKDRLSSQQISTISMGLARLNYKSILSSSFSSSYSSSSSSSSANNCSENILKTLSSSALNVISEFTFQDLENCLVSLEKLDVEQIGKKEFGYKKLLKSAVTRAAVLFEMKEGENNGMDIQKTFIAIEPQNVCNFMLVLAKFKWKRDLGKLVQFSETYIINKMKSLTPRDIANVAWAFSKLGIGRKAVASLSNEAVTRMEDFNAQEVSKLLYAIDKCNIKNEKLQEMYSKPVQLNFRFNNLTQEIKINHLPGGGRDQSHQRELTGATGATGCSLWDPSIALSYFLSDHFVSMNDDRKDYNTLFPNCEFDFKSWFASLDKIVELGSGIGLCSIVAGKVFNHSSGNGNKVCQVLSTDGDDDVCKLLQNNITLNDMNSSIVDTRTISWGVKGKKLKDILQINSLKEVKLIMASGCVYGSDPDNWKSLYKTIRSMSSKRSNNTLIMLSHGNGAAPGVFEGDGDFYNQFIRKKFNVYIVPPNLLNVKYRESCSIHMLWRGE